MRPEQITNFLTLLKDEGWSYRESRMAGYTSWWQISSKIGKRKLSIYSGLDQNVISFQLPMGGLEDAPPECIRAVTQYLLQLNTQAKLVRFGLDQYYQMYLLADVLQDSCTFTVYKTTLEAVRSYYGEHYREIEVLASNTALAGLFLALNQRESLPLSFVSES